jgi:hypothetical protein
MNRRARWAFFSLGIILAFMVGAGTPALLANVGSDGQERSVPLPTTTTTTRVTAEPIEGLT